MRSPPLRFRALFALASLSLAVSWASGARAQQSIDDYNTFRGGRDENGPAESPQNAAFELRVGRYVPNIDDEFADQKPYEQTFGTKNRYSIGLEVDWQAMRIPYVGTLGPGIGIEYTKISAHSFVASDPTLQTRAGEGEVSSLTILPMYLVAVLRADYFARESKIPLVPYAKLGVGWAFWSLGNGTGTANVNGISGRGTSYGFQWALGGMLLLDALDPHSALQMDANTGVNNSYFFVEWYDSKLNGFGSGGQMQVGSNTWVLGLAFEI
ncbi:MAG TPA: MXAN_2562 family outer membrane beta-barrel protein [Polyangiaceae bacterium]|nr:MXAN_2562 family outer membrane beta-barrel protein [Polyangiaceae bacterium]